MEIKEEDHEHVLIASTSGERVIAGVSAVIGIIVLAVHFSVASPGRPTDVFDVVPIVISLVFAFLVFAFALIPA